MDGSGFVRRSEVFDGDVVEDTTLEAMLQGLGAPLGALWSWIVGLRPYL